LWTYTLLNSKLYMEIIISVLVGLVGLGIGIFVGLNIIKGSKSKQEQEAKEKAELFLKEAQLKADSFKESKKIEAKEHFLKLKTEFEEDTLKRKREANELENKLKQEQNRLKQLQDQVAKKEENLERKDAEIDSARENVTAQLQQVSKRKEEADKLVSEQVHRLEKIAGLTANEAREQIMNTLRQEAESKAGSYIKDIVEEAKLTATKEAKKVVLDTIQRTATEHAIENCVSVFNIESDEVKGKIIGREGRNIRTLEAATGVEIIVDDTPDAIIISGFDPVRREIARLSLHRLVVDGRIHPARIEEIVAKTRKNIDDEIIEIGEKTCIDLGIHGLHPELIKMVGRMRYRSSYGQNLLQHSREVAKLCATMAAELGLNAKLAKRAGLLHDIGKVWPDEPELPHAILGMQMAQKYKEHPEVINAIGAHHDEIEMTSLLSPIIQACDAISGSRPGARREVMESYIKRLKDMEELATSFDGVTNCYAIQAGRELRVVVDAEKMSDQKSTDLSFNISQRIEKEMQYPGQIKVTVIRETRAVSFAK